MSGCIIVTDDLVDSLIHFTEECGARSPGWFCAECETCGVTTTGTENTVEDWAYEHVFEEHRKWTIQKCRHGGRRWHIYSPGGSLDYEVRTGEEAIALVRGKLS